MGLALKAPLTSYDVIYTLPMLTVKEEKGNEHVEHIAVDPAVLGIQYPVPIQAVNWQQLV